MLAQTGLDLLINVIGGLIVAALLAWLKGVNILPWLPAPPPEPTPVSVPEPASLSERQARNRARAKVFLMHFVFYAWTLMLLYLCVSAPIVLKALISKTPVYLDSAPYIGALMPHAEVGRHTFQWPFAAVTLALYVPLLFISSAMVQPVDWLVRIVYTMNAWQRRMAQALLFALAALLVSGFTIHFYYAVPLGRALGIPFFVVLGVGFFLWASHEDSKTVRG